MGKASKVLYTIGKVFNIIEIVFLVVLLVGGIIINASPEMLVESMPEAYETVEMAKAASVGLIVAAIIGLIVSIVVLIFAIRAKKAVDDGKKNLAPHIIMVVIGVISGDMFYLLGGIFGIIAESNSENK